MRARIDLETGETTTAAIPMRMAELAPKCCQGIWKVVENFSWELIFNACFVSLASTDEDLSRIFAFLMMQKNDRK